MGIASPSCGLALSASFLAVVEDTIHVLGYSCITLDLEVQSWLCWDCVQNCALVGSILVDEHIRRLPGAALEDLLVGSLESSYFSRMVWHASTWYPYQHGQFASLGRRGLVHGDRE
jgi:hypothetical protein